jgi:hypothetical protein
MKPLATSNIFNVLLFPVVLLIVLSLVAMGGGGGTVIPIPFLVFVFIVLGFWIFFGIRDTCNVSYDDHFIYLEGLLSNHRIPLSGITKVARDNTGMRTSGITAWKYRLEFDRSIKISPQIIYEAEGDTRVKAFIAFVKERNPALVVE